MKSFKLYAKSASLQVFGQVTAEYYVLRNVSFFCCCFSLPMSCLTDVLQYFEIRCYSCCKVIRLLFQTADIIKYTERYWVKFPPYCFQNVRRPRLLKRVALKFSDVLNFHSPIYFFRVKYSEAEVSRFHRNIGTALQKLHRFTCR